MINEFAATETCEELRVTWTSGEVTNLSAALLRREARDAWSIRERLDHGAVQVLPGLRITGIYQVGAEGVNLHFSDGHEKAIYPFSYLRELSDHFDN